MKKQDLERLTDGMVQGRGEFTVEDSDENERPYNLTGAVNAITNILDEMEKYGLELSDLTDEQREDLDLAQQAIQYYEAELGSLISKVSEDDGSVELPNGEVIDLPNEASANRQAAKIPENTNE